MEPLNVLEEVSLPLGPELAVGTLNLLGQVDFADVVAQIAHGERRVVADGAVVPVLHAVVELDQGLWCVFGGVVVTYKEKCKTNLRRIAH